MKPKSIIPLFLLPLLSAAIAGETALERLAAEIDNHAETEQSLPEFVISAVIQNGNQLQATKLCFFASEGISREKVALMQHLICRDRQYLPNAPWGVLYSSPVRADEEFMVAAITGYTSGVDATTLFVYRPSDETWQLRCILDCLDLGLHRVQISDAGEDALQICGIPPMGKSRLLPFVYTFELPEKGGKIPRFHVCPSGVTQKGFFHSDEPESVQVYLRLNMAEPLKMCSVSMDADATPDSVSLEIKYYEADRVVEEDALHVDDVVIGDEPVDAAAFVHQAKRMSGLQGLLIPREAVMPGSIEMGWAFHAESARWLLLLRHENGQTWSYDFEQNGFVPTHLTGLSFAWKP